jgi:hypothetical protein
VYRTDIDDATAAALFLIICLAANCVPKKALLRLTAITLSYCASIVSRTEVRVSMPALFTIMSSRPKLSTAASTSFSRSGTFAHISRDAGALAYELADLSLERLRRLWTDHVIDDDACLLAGQFENDRLPDPAVAASDDGNLVFQRHDQPLNISCPIVSRDQA